MVRRCSIVRKHSQVVSPSQHVSGSEQVGPSFDPSHHVPAVLILVSITQTYKGKANILQQYQ